LHLESQGLDPLPSGDTEQDPGMLDLEPRPRAAVGNDSQHCNVIGIED